MGQLLFADAIHIREQAKIDAARITQKSGNEKRGAESTLATFSASLGNLRALAAAGSAFNDAQGNLSRQLSDASTGPLKMRLAAAEELGATAAMAGSAGVGGGSVTQYNEAVALSEAMQEERFGRDVAAQEYGASQSAGHLVSNAVAALDNTSYRANLDYTQYVNHNKPSIFERIAGIGLTAAATVFGGPQAGSAVMGVFEARASASNGDFGGASSAITGAIQNGIGAVRSTAATRGGPGAAPSTPVQTGFFNPGAGNGNTSNVGGINLPNGFLGNGTNLGSIILH